MLFTAVTQVQIPSGAPRLSIRSYTDIAVQRRHQFRWVLSYPLLCSEQARLGCLGFGYDIANCEARFIVIYRKFVVFLLLAGSVESLRHSVPC